LRRIALTFEPMPRAVPAKELIHTAVRERLAVQQSALVAEVRQP